MKKPTYALWVAGLFIVAAAFVAAYVGFVRTVTGQAIDDSALVAAHEFLAADATRRTALGFLAHLPEISLGVVLGTAVLAAVMRRTFISPALALGSALAATLATQLLKWALSRPDLGISAAKLNSFPSGHTTVAAAAMMAVVLLVAPRWRPLAASLGGIFSGLAGAATYILGWHRPADIVGAYLVAGFFGLIGGALILRKEPDWNTWTSERGPSGFWLAFPWVPGMVGLGVTLGIYLLVLRGQEGEAGGSLLGWALVAGLAFIGGVAMTVMAAAASLLTWETRAERRVR